MSEIAGPRIRVIAGGTLLVVASVLVGWVVAVGITSPGRENIFRAFWRFALVTAIASLATAVPWTRRLRPSESEALGALLLAEVVWLGIAHAAGWFSIVWFLFLFVLNLVTVPWWVAGFLIARATGRGTHEWSGPPDE